MKIIECVPNFSEGRDTKIIRAIAGVFDNRAGVKLVNYSADTDHNRSVYTFLGKPEAVLEAALAACGKALELIDMTKHEGVHPRLGAVDVVPFIPLQQAQMKDAIDLAHSFGREYNLRFSVPVYFYGSAALREERRELADVRRGNYESLAAKIITKEGAPDIGKPEFNARLGATVVGARKPLVAFNINLASADLKLAKEIAAAIREKSGGLKHVRAIGVMLQAGGKKVAQVSMNLTDCRETPLKKVYNQVKSIAARHGVNIGESELIGLLPQEALCGTTPEKLQLKHFNESCLLETHLTNFSR